MKLRSGENLLLLGTGLLGAVVLFWMFGRVDPSARLGLATNRSEAQETARRYVDSLRVQVRGLRSTTSLVIDDVEEGFLQSQRVEGAERQRIEAYHPVAAWKVVYVKSRSSEHITVLVDGRGQVFRYEHVLPADAAGKNLTQAEARRKVEQFLARHRGIVWADYQLVDAQTVRRALRTDHTFRWEKKGTGVGGLKFRLWATVQGDEIGGWDRHLQIPQSFVDRYNSRLNAGEIFAFGRQLVPLAVVVLSLIVFVLRFRAGEVSVRNALLFAGVTLVVGLLYYANVFASQDNELFAATGESRGLYMFFLLVLPLLAATLSAIGAFLVWAGGESLTREVWPEKLKSFDALFAGRFFTSGIGAGVLRGFSLGMITAGLWYLLLYLAAKRADVWVLFGQGSSSQSVTTRMALSAYVPIGFSVVLGLSATLFALSYAPLFTLAYLKRSLKSTSWAVALTILLFHMPLPGSSAVQSAWLEASVAIPIALISYLFYLRYDLLTVGVGFLVSIALPFSIVYLAQPDTVFRAAGWTSLVLLALLGVFGLVASARGSDVDEEGITPSYVRYITERERLKMELEIARQAQLRMLPQQVPQLPGLDVAAFTEPAREVGGDYYDFVCLDGNRLGVVIGDVSGKGMPAALYMTLTKGVLQAHVGAAASPKETLCRVNRSFYQAAERNTFISLFYCVIDPIGRKVVCARAGHNPMILRRSGDRSIRCVQPPGLAIGLEPGELFEKVMREESLRLRPGDVLFFYTDGLTEGMNHGKEEFGEARLIEAIERADGASAAELLQRVRRAHEAFVGREHQHDDMTCLAVKVV